MSGVTQGKSNRKVGLMALSIALAMLGLGYASVPLYRIFCQVTGYGGTTQRASAAEAGGIKVSERTISVRFDGNVDRGMPWRFGPEQVTQQMRIGERKLAFFKAENLSDHAITGVASFNVTPELAGQYFKKVHCFCFNQQTLKPGEKVDMPVQYFVDPAILDDPDTAHFQQITLSYTFHQVEDEASKALDRSGGAG